MTHTLSGYTKPVVTRLLKVATAASLGILLAGCVSDGTAGRPSAPVKRPAGPAAATSPGTPEPTILPSPARRVSLGQVVSTPVNTVGVQFTETVLQYRQPAAPAAPTPTQPDRVWTAAEVKTCQVTQIQVPSPTSPMSDLYRPGWVITVMVSNAPWHLRLSDGTLVAPSQVDSPQFPQPEYPQRRVIQFRECVTGWITYAVPGLRRPVGVVDYEPGTPQEPIEWAIA